MGTAGCLLVMCVLVVVLGFLQDRPSPPATPGIWNTDLQWEIVTPTKAPTHTPTPGIIDLSKPTTETTPAPQ